MDGVIRIIERLVLDSLISDQMPSNPYHKINKRLFVFSLFLAFFGFVFILYSLFLWILLYHPLHVAVVVIGAICTFLGGIIFIATYFFTIYQKNSFKRISKKVTEKIKHSFSEMDDEWGHIIRENPKMAVVISTILGFIIEQNFNKEGNKI